MNLPKIRVQIDNDDGEECPDKPFTATLWIGEEYATVEAGIGATAAEALANIHPDEELLPPEVWVTTFGAPGRWVSS